MADPDKVANKVLFLAFLPNIQEKLVHIYEGDLLCELLSWYRLHTTGSMEWK